MAAVGSRSPPRSDNKIQGSVAPGLAGTMGQIRPPRPQKLFPEHHQQLVELPKVLQQPSFCRASLQQQSLPTCARPGSRIQSSIPCLAPRSTPPLIVRSMVVTPRSPNRIRSVSALSAAHTRQKSASPSVRMSQIMSVHSPGRSSNTACLSDSALGDGIVFEPSVENQDLAADVCNLVGDTVSDMENWRDRSANRGGSRVLSEKLTRQSSSDREGREEQLKPESQDTNSDGVGQQFRNTDDTSDLLITESGDDTDSKRPSCRRNLAREQLEKELTFKPELNQKSLKIASRSTRQCVPLVCRLTERRKRAEHSNYSFAPRINPHSIKLAQERAGKIDEVSNNTILGGFHGSIVTSVRWCENNPFSVFGRFKEPN